MIKLPLKQVEQIQLYFLGDNEGTVWHFGVNLSAVQIASREPSKLGITIGSFPNNLQRDQTLAKNPSFNFYQKSIIISINIIGHTKSIFINIIINLPDQNFPNGVLCSQKEPTLCKSVGSCLLIIIIIIHNSPK